MLTLKLDRQPRLQLRRSSTFQTAALQHGTALAMVGRRTPLNSSSLLSQLYVIDASAATLGAADRLKLLHGLPLVTLGVPS